MKKHGWNWRLTFGLLFLLIIALHFPSGRPYRGDEELILTHLQNGKASEVFGRLSHGQAFPRFHPILIYGLEKWLGDSVWVLRLLPLLSMMGAFLTWWKLYEETLETESAKRWVTLGWVGSAPLTFYASDLKQYSGDVLIVAIFLFALLKQHELLTKNGNRWPRFFYGFLPLLVLFSYPSVLFAWMPLYNGILAARKNPKYGADVLVYAVSVLTAGILLYAFDIRYTLQEKAVHDRWESYFISLGSLPEFRETFSEAWNRFLTRWFAVEEGFRDLSYPFLPVALLALLHWIRHGAREIFHGIHSIRTAAGVMSLELIALSVAKLYLFRREPTHLVCCSPRHYDDCGGNGANREAPSPIATDLNRLLHNLPSRPRSLPHFPLFRACPHSVPRRVRARVSALVAQAYC